MKKIFLFILLLICTFSVIRVEAATTYYVRTDGGTSVQCLGTTNAAYSGSGTGQACAYSHPAWALGAYGTAAKMVGGDTLIISDTASAAYMVGFGMPNTAGCSAGAPQPCVLNTIPSGTDAAHPTRILGSSYATGCSTKPQLWATQGVYTVLDATGKSNVDIECIEITDHSTCGYSTGGNQCSTSGTFGTYGRDAVQIRGGAANIILKNDDFHGMAYRGLWAGGVNGMNISHVNLTGNHFANWDADVHLYGNAGFSGNLIFDRLKVRFSGCREAYPASASFAVGDYNDCTNGGNGGGYGDGLGAYNTSGHFIITNSEFSHNTSDGLDLLYGINTLDLDVDKSLFEGNSGNQLKFTGRNVNVTNSVFVSNCDYFNVNNKLYDATNFERCRAGGTPIVAVIGGGGTWKFTNNTAYTSTGGSGSAFLEVYNNGGYCLGTETYTFKNNILKSNHSATNWVPYYNGGLTGSCSTAFSNATTTYSQIYDFSTNPSGTGNVFTNPAWVGAISSSASSNVANVYLTSNVGGGNAATYWNTSTDYNSFAQNASIDRGALQYGTSAQLAQAGQACVTTTDCASGSCTAFVCSGSCTANTVACSTNAQCCSGYCSTTCQAPPTCGDGVIQPPEACDTSGPTLNGSTCVQRGFTGGSLGCTAGCASFDTSACTNTLVFPLTGILDSFTRADSTGLGANWTNLNGRIDIASNKAKPINGAGVEDFYYWNPTVFAADEEAYATIATKGTNNDDMILSLRRNVTTGTGYRLEVQPTTNKVAIYRLDTAGSETLLGTTITQAYSSGDSFGMSIVGSTITVYYKASAGSWTSIGTRTDTTYALGGQLAFGNYSGASTPDIRVTNLGGGSINPIVCGNGLKEGSEVCDGSDVASQTCVSQGYASGTLACLSNCTAFDTTSCVTASSCGNNTKQPGELCDGTDLNSQTCVLQGYNSGTLTCSSDCLSFVTTGCVSGGTGITGGVTIK